MYIPKHFEILDEKKIYKLIGMNSFDQLISLHDAKIVSTLKPFLFDTGTRILFSHLAKANSQWQQISNQEVLVTLQGDQIYVTSS